MCPLGQYSVAGAMCTLCPVGRYGGAAGMFAGACQLYSSSQKSCASCERACCRRCISRFGACCALGLTSPNCSGSCSPVPGRFCGYGAPVSLGPLCPIGQYSDGTGPSAWCQPCAPGRFGNSTFGLNWNSNCAGPCTPTAGTYCPAGATSPTPVQCPAGRYSISGSLGACTVCPVGQYGAAPGLAASSCSGPCVAAVGSWCGLGETTVGGSQCTSGNSACFGGH